MTTSAPLIVYPKGLDTPTVKIQGGNQPTTPRGCSLSERSDTELT